MRRLWLQLTELWLLAWPLALVQLNNNLTGAVDTALAGRVDQATLGATGLGASVFVAVSVIGMGAGLGVEPLAAQAFGRDDPQAARHIMHQGIWVALALSIPLLLLALFLSYSLGTLGVSPKVADGAYAYLIGRLPAVPGHCVLMVVRSFLQSARITRPILISALAMNFFNIVADWLLLFGDAGLTSFGLPAVGLQPMGTFGLGLASALATYVQLGLLLLALCYVPRGRSPLLCCAIDWPLARQITRLGLPAGAQILAEVGIFSLVSILMGSMGTATAAAHQTAIMFASLSFAVCVGIGAATSVQVGRAIGRADMHGTRLAGIAGLVLGLGAMSISAACMWLWPATLVSVMTDDEVVIGEAARLLGIAGVFQLVDGAQVVAGGALRGAGETRFAFIANVVAHWGIGLPIALWLAYGLELGPQGLWWGLTAGLVFVAVALCGRFWELSRRPISAVEY